MKYNVNTPQDFDIDMDDSRLHGMQKPSFWLLHLFGWMAYVVIFSFDNILFTKENDVSFAVIIPLCISATMAFLLTLPLRNIYAKCWQFSPQKLIATIVLASFIVALIWTPSKNLTMWTFNEHIDVTDWANLSMDETHNPWGILSTLSYSFFMILVWSSLYFGINYHYRLVTEKQLHIDAVRLSHHAQIKMLRYQINPHFLFNTLNAISTLVLQGQKEKANGMLVRLSTFLRFSLDNDPEKKIPLIDEIKASMLYLEIEKTRFEDRLAISLKVQAEAEYMLVPSLILQPLIENSIKFAIANMAADGVIEIEAKIQNDMLHMCVADNGPGILKTSCEQASENKANTGVGITNIRDRLNVLYPAQHMFEIDDQADVGFMVKIAIPMELA